MKRGRPLAALLLALLAVALMAGCREEGAKEGDRAVVSRNEQFGRVGGSVLAEFTAPEEVDLFLTVVQKAEKLPGILNVTHPNFDVVVESGGDRWAFHLWLGPESGMLMYVEDTHTGYRLPAEAASRLHALLRGAEEAPAIPEAAAGPGARSVLTAYSGWNGELVCGNRRYRPGDAIYFTGEEVVCRMDLPFDEPLNATTDDLRQLEQVAISYEGDDEYDIIELSAGSQLPHALALRVRQWRPVDVAFAAPNGGEPRVFRFESVPPLTYSISRPIEADNEKQATTAVRHYLKTGETHVYQIEFSRPVDRAAAERVLAGQLEPIDAELEWSSPRSLSVTLRFKDEDIDGTQYGQYGLNLYGIVDERGIPVNTDARESPYLFFQPAAMGRYALYDADQGTDQTLFETLISYSALDVSPDGELIIAEELSARESVLVPSYSLLNRSGKRLKTLAMTSPAWSPDGRAILYEEQGEVMRYDVSTGASRPIWSSGEEETALISFRVDPASGHMIVAAGYPEGDGFAAVDLFLFEGIDDPEPRRLAQAFRIREDESWYGLRYELPVHFLREDLLYLENVAANARQLLSWEDTGVRELTLTEEAYPLPGGRFLLRENGAWGLYDVDSGTAKPLALPGGVPWFGIVGAGADLAILFGPEERQWVLHTRAGTVREVPSPLAIRATGFVSGGSIVVRDAGR